VGASAKGSLGLVHCHPIDPASRMGHSAHPLPFRECLCERLGDRVGGYGAIADHQPNAVDQPLILGVVPSVEVHRHTFPSHELVQK